MSETFTGSVLVLGIGNILWADEGFGVRCVETLDRDYVFTGDVTIMDGGTQGMNLVGPICEADRVVVFDAVDFGAPDGELVIVRDDNVPSFMGAKKMSLHQNGFQDVLASADLLNKSPEKITLIGVQPVQLEDYGGSLTDTVKACIAPAVAAGLRELRDWGVLAETRPAGTYHDGVVLREVELNPYEADRPSADLACRIGDDRVLMRRLESQQLNEA